MSRTLIVLLIGFAATVMLGVLGVVAFLTLVTPVSVVTATAVVPSVSPTPIVPVVVTETTSTAAPTTAATSTATAIPATAVPATAISAAATTVQYIMAQTDVNIRSGPGVNYGVVGWVAEGQIAKVTGVSSDSGWWRVVCPDGSTGSCWVTARAQYTIPTTAPGSPPTAVPGTTACTNSASLVADVTIPDGTQIAPSTGFNKTWRLKNTGTCTWDHRYKLVLAGGHALGAITTGFPLPDGIVPGQTVDLTVSLVSPAAPNTYQGDWKLQDPQGQPFGVGRRHSPFWVKIVVTGGATTTISGYVYQDANQNGRYDPGEVLMGDREVWLMPGPACQVQQNASERVFSGTDGRYTFKGNYAGNYCVGLIGANGLDDVVGVAVAPEQVLTDIDLRWPVPAGTISGFLWNDYCLTNENGDALDGSCVADGNGDYHADGMIEPHESYIPGVTILLQTGPCATNHSVAVAAVTDASGKYIFGNLQPGVYCVSMNAAAPENAPKLLPGDWTFPNRGVWYQEITLLGADQAYPVNFGWDYQLK